MLKNLEGQGFTIQAGSEATVDIASKVITYGSNTKKWELLEEFGHVRVGNGWKAEEIAELTRTLKKSWRTPSGKWVRPHEPARAAEEIVVK